VKNVALAGRYARGLFIVTERRRETAQALADLLGLLEVLKPGSRVAYFLATPEVRLLEKRAALERGLKGRVLPVVGLFIDLLLRKKRMGEFATAVAEFESLVEKAQGIQRAQVVSATPLNEAELERLHRELERFTGSHIKITTALEPELLGGALVKIGDRVIDRSVRTLLRAIAEQLQEVSV
jgi:F-type H+-transporting ATPase subunit delta